MESEKKIRVFMISRQGLGNYLESDIEVAIEELRLSWENDSPGDELWFTVMEMTQCHVAPHAEGWIRHQPIEGPTLWEEYYGNDAEQTRVLNGAFSR